MTEYALLFTLAAIGISETSYLIRTREKQEKPVCIIGEDCHKVLESKYNKFLGIHNDVWGFVFYFGIAFLNAIRVIGIGNTQLLNWLIGFGILVGTIISILFVYIQVVILKKWCFWCMLSAITVFSMFLIYLISLFYV